MGTMDTGSPVKADGHFNWMQQKTRDTARDIKANTVGTTAAGGATGTQWPLHGQRSGDTSEGRTCGDRKVKRSMTP